jgi:hypothetical protein
MFLQNSEQLLGFYFGELITNDYWSLSVSMKKGIFSPGGRGFNSIRDGLGFSD